MEATLELCPGVTLRCRRVTRFKQAALSLQLLRPMQAQEAATNALIPALLLRGCQGYPDLKCITEHLDDLYGASVGTLVRRIGDYQTTGFYCGFVEDRFALPGDRVLEPMVTFLGQLLLQPLTEDGGFLPAYTESEKKNLISTIESERSDKRAYAAGKLLKNMCCNDPFGLPRLGEVQQVRLVDHRSAYVHYQKILAESPIEIFYVGSGEPEYLAQLLRPIFAGISRNFQPLGPQTPFREGPESHETEIQEIAQAKLSMGFVTPVTSKDLRFAAMQLCNCIFGGGMSNQIFTRIREELSLCYDIGSGYYGAKGILTVHAGIDADQEEAVRREVLEILKGCQAGKITQRELSAAKEALLSSLRAVYDSPGAMENYFSTAAISGLGRTPEVYSQELRACTLEDVVAAAQSIRYHSSFFLKGDQHE